MKTFQALEIIAKITSPYINDRKLLKKLISSLDSSQWEKIVTLANKNQVVTNLYNALKKKNLLCYISDKQLLGYFKEVTKLNGLRNRYILEQVDEISKIFQNRDITFTLLKGVASLERGYYNDISERVMLDIDILVEKEKIFEAIHLLKQNGYKEISSIPLLSNWHHYNRLYHPKKMTSLEVHRYALSNYKLFPINLKEGIHLQKSSTFFNAYTLMPNYELIHVFLHSQISHRHHKNFFLDIKQLLHFITLLNYYEKEIDFAFINEFMSSNNLQKSWNEYCYTLQKLFNVKFPFPLKNHKRYISNIEYFINNPTCWYVRGYKMKNKIFHFFSYQSLQRRYNFNKRSSYIFYLIRYFFYGIKVFIKNKEKRRDFFK